MNLSNNRFSILLLSLIILFGISCNKEDDEVNFLGTYDVLEVCGLGNDNYQITIVEGDSEDEIIIENFYNFPVAELKANVIGNELDIPSQTFNSVVTFEGTGSLEDGTLTINFIVEEGGETDNCEITASM